MIERVALTVAAVVVVGWFLFVESPVRWPPRLVIHPDWRARFRRGLHSAIDCRFER